MIRNTENERRQIISDIELADSCIDSAFYKDGVLRFELSDMLTSPRHTENKTGRYALCDGILTFRDVKKLSISYIRRISYQIGSDPKKARKRCYERPVEIPVYKSGYDSFFDALADSDISLFEKNIIMNEENGYARVFDGMYQADIFLPDGEKYAAMTFYSDDVSFEMTGIRKMPPKTVTELMNMLPVIYVTRHDRNAPLLARALCLLIIFIDRSPITLLPPFVRDRESFTYQKAIPFLIKCTIDKIPIDTYRLRGKRPEGATGVKRWYYAVPIILVYIAVLSMLTGLLIDFIFTI